MLDVMNINKSYKKAGLFSKKHQQVLRNVTFSMKSSDCLAIIGQSGSGKSTLARLILGIDQPSSGKIFLNGKDVRFHTNRLGKISAVFQDYTSSINPNMTVGQAIKEPMDVIGKYHDASIVENLLQQVGLHSGYLGRLPHELSGGEVQRVCIARAISTEPQLLILDEAVSSLDVSIQLQILELLKNIRKQHNMSYLFITHDIQAAAYICDRLIIFNDGCIIEQLPTADIGKAKAAYSKQLLNAVITI